MFSPALALMALDTPNRAKKGVMLQHIDIFYGKVYCELGGTTQCTMRKNQLLSQTLNEQSKK